MNVVNATILKHLSKLYSIAKNVTNKSKLLDEIEDECYEMLEYTNQVRRKEKIYHVQDLHS